MKKLNKTLIFTTAAAAVLAMGVNDYVHNDQLTVHAEITKNNDNEYAYYYNAASGAASVAASNASMTQSGYISASSLLSSMEIYSKKVKSEYAYSAADTINDMKYISGILKDKSSKTSSYANQANLAFDIVKRNYDQITNSSAASTAVFNANRSSLYAYEIEDYGINKNNKKFNSYIEGNENDINKYYYDTASNAVSNASSNYSRTYSGYLNASSLLSSMDSSVKKVNSSYAYSAAYAINDMRYISSVLKDKSSKTSSYANQASLAFDTLKRNYNQSTNSNAASTAVFNASRSSLYAYDIEDYGINKNVSNFNSYIGNNDNDINDYYYSATSTAVSVANLNVSKTHSGYLNASSLLSSMDSSIGKVKSEYAYSAADTINDMRYISSILKDKLSKTNSYASHASFALDTLKRNYNLLTNSSAASTAVFNANRSSLYAYDIEDYGINKNISKFKLYIDNSIIIDKDKNNHQINDSNSSLKPSSEVNSSHTIINTELSSTSSSVPESSNATNSVSVISSSASSSSESSSVISSSSSELSSSTISSSVMSSSESSIAESSNVSSSSSLQESSSTVNSNSTSVISDSSSATSSSVISSSAGSSSTESSASTSSSSASSSSVTTPSSSNNSNPLIDYITPYSSTYTPQISADNTNKIYYYSVDSSSSTTSSSSSVAISSSSNDSTVSSTANSSYSSKNNSDVSSSTNKNNLNTKSKNNSSLSKKQVKKKVLTRTINKINKSLSNEKDKIKNSKNSKDKSKHSKKYNKLKESLKKLKFEYQRI